MQSINEVIETLRDGKWHKLGEIIERSGLHEFKVGMIMSFLAEYDFIRLDKERRKAKLTSPVLKFLREIQRIEDEEAP